MYFNFQRLSFSAQLGTDLIIQNILLNVTQFFYLSVYETVHLWNIFFFKHKNLKISWHYPKTWNSASGQATTYVQMFIGRDRWIASASCISGILRPGGS